jgi:hypothetical protein
MQQPVIHIFCILILAHFHCCSKLEIPCNIKLVTRKGHLLDKRDVSGHGEGFVSLQNVWRAHPSGSITAASALIMSFLVKGGQFGSMVPVIHNSQECAETCWDWDAHHVPAIEWARTVPY